jgi:hypothetical protein
MITDDEINESYLRKIHFHVVDTCACPYTARLLDEVERLRAELNEAQGDGTGYYMLWQDEQAKLAKAVAELKYAEEWADHLSLREHIRQTLKEIQG